MVWGDLAEIKATVTALSEQVGPVIASGQHSSGPTDAQGVSTALANGSSIKASIAKWGGKWLNSVIAHIPRAALANPVVTIAMADAYGTPIDLTLTPTSPSQAAAVNALTASGLAATSLPGPLAPPLGNRRLDGGTVGKSSRNSLSISGARAVLT